VGRTPELATLADAVRAGTRLITLVGPAGTGRTRLALRFAATRHERPRDRAWFCDGCAILTNAAQFAARVGRPADAVAALHEAIEIAARVGDRETEGSLALRIGKVVAATGAPPGDALAWLTRAEAIFADDAAGLGQVRDARAKLAV
jgi:hypothetical protein